MRVASALLIAVARPFAAAITIVILSPYVRRHSASDTVGVALGVGDAGAFDAAAGVWGTAAVVEAAVGVRVGTCRAGVGAVSAVDVVPELSSPPTTEPTITRTASPIQAVTWILVGSDRNLRHQPGPRLVSLTGRPPNARETRTVTPGVPVSRYVI